MRATLKRNFKRGFILKNKQTQEKKNNFWILKTFILTFSLAMVFAVVSGEVLEKVNNIVAVLILLLIILVGIIFDMIGVAVTAAEEAPFNAMATRHIKGAKRALKLIKSRDKVSNFCNDVIGDICGIISGSASAAVIAHMAVNMGNTKEFVFDLVVTALVAGLTVGGKAMGKSFAINNSKNIVFTAAKVLSVFSKEK